MEGLTVFVHKRVDGDLSVHTAVISKLQALGAVVAKRLCKEVTHVVFLRKLLPSHVEQAQQNEALRDLHDRLFKVNPAALVVSNLWVHATSELGKKANEADFLISRPPVAPPARFLTLTPEDGGKGRKRTPKRANLHSVPLPGDAFSFDVDAMLFSSSQQIEQGGSKGLFGMDTAAHGGRAAAAGAAASHTPGAAPSTSRKRRASAPEHALIQPTKALRLQHQSDAPTSAFNRHARSATDPGYPEQQQPPLPTTSAAGPSDPPPHASLMMGGGFVLGTGLRPALGAAGTPVGDGAGLGAGAAGAAAAQQQQAPRTRRSVVWADNLTPETSPAHGLMLGGRSVRSRRGSGDGGPSPASEGQGWPGSVSCSPAMGLATGLISGGASPAMGLTTGLISGGTSPAFAGASGGDQGWVCDQGWGFGDGGSHLSVPLLSPCQQDVSPMASLGNAGATLGNGPASHGLPCRLEDLGRRHTPHLKGGGMQRMGGPDTMQLRSAMQPSAMHLMAPSPMQGMAPSPMQGMAPSPMQGVAPSPMQPSAMQLRSAPNSVRRSARRAGLTPQRQGADTTPTPPPGQQQGPAAPPAEQPGWMLDRCPPTQACSTPVLLPITNLQPPAAAAAVPTASAAPPAEPKPQQPDGGGWQPQLRPAGAARLAQTAALAASDGGVAGQQPVAPAARLLLKHKRHKSTSSTPPTSAPLIKAPALLVAPTITATAIATLAAAPTVMAEPPPSTHGAPPTLTLTPTVTPAVTPLVTPGFHTPTQAPSSPVAQAVTGLRSREMDIEMEIPATVIPSSVITNWDDPGVPLLGARSVQLVRRRTRSHTRTASVEPDDAGLGAAAGACPGSCPQVNRLSRGHAGGSGLVGGGSGHGGGSGQGGSQPALASGPQAAAAAAAVQQDVFGSPVVSLLSLLPPHPAAGTRGTAQHLDSDPAAPPHPVSASVGIGEPALGAGGGQEGLTAMELGGSSGACAAAPNDHEAGPDSGQLHGEHTHHTRAAAMQPQQQQQEKRAAAGRGAGTSRTAEQAGAPPVQPRATAGSGAGGRSRAAQQAGPAAPCVILLSPLGSPIPAPARPSAPASGQPSDATRPQPPGPPQHAPPQAAPAPASSARMPTAPAPGQKFRQSKLCVPRLKAAGQQQAAGSRPAEGDAGQQHGQQHQEQGQGQQQQGHSGGGGALAPAAQALVPAVQSKVVVL